MRLRSLSALLLVVAVCFVLAVAAEVFVDDFVRPRSLFAYLLASTLVTALAALAVNVEVPN